MRFLLPECIFESGIFLVGNRLAPFVAGILAGNLHGNVAEPRIGLRPMPVLDICRNGDDRTRRQGDGLFALLLIPALARGADQQLPAAFGGMVDVPVVPASRLEGHIGQEHGALAGNGQGLEVGLAGKVPGIGVIGRADAEGVLLFILNSN